MNVSCNKCGKRYVIADDKVAGKTSVKIRCKQCQNLISVGIGAGAGAQPGVGGGAGSASAIMSASGVMPAPEGFGSASGISGAPKPPDGAYDDDERTQAMPALDMSSQWFAMVQGKQIGPLDLRALLSKVSAGEVSLRTYLWKQGMGDWKRASDVPEVAPIFAGNANGATATSPTQGPPPPAKVAGPRA